DNSRSRSALRLRTTRSWAASTRAASSNVDEPRGPRSLVARRYRGPRGFPDTGAGSVRGPGRAHEPGRLRAEGTSGSHGPHARGVPLCPALDSSYRAFKDRLESAG